MRERQLSAGATSEPQEKSSTSVGPNAKDPPDLVALRPAAAYTHIRNMLAVVADHVVSKLWLKPKQELGPLRDLPWRVSCWMVASEPAKATFNRQLKFIKSWLYSQIYPGAAPDQPGA